MSFAPSVPPHLRKYVVEQDYGAYTARDHAVWRFVVSQGHARLCEIAHPAYAAGFAAAGITTTRIPDLRVMDAQLAACGFRVVCVDGFIPPRAFQAFQARGILPVAADIRSAAHLTYTPAPDIIHEAAGHAPFLAHPAYAAFLRRIGAVSERAFESEHDRALYRTIYRLSEMKEDRSSGADAIALVEAELAALRTQQVPVSEAARMARLYWWTVEYGLVGKITDFRLYGAGLLSSMGEAHFCYDPRVQKLPLSADCVDVDYDITQAQPQLFVAADFEQLESVLSDVERTLSHVRGGEVALREAVASGDVATVELDTGFAVVGAVRDFNEGFVRFEGPCALAEATVLCAEHRERPAEYVLPLGALSDGTSLSQLSPTRFDALVRDDTLSLTTRAGLHVHGRVERVHVRAGAVYAVTLSACRIGRGEARLLSHDAPIPLLLAGAVRTASPVIPEGFYQATAYPAVRVPKPYALAAEERELIDFHTQLSEMLDTGVASADAVARLTRMHERLCAAYPEEWLLRVNMLEVLLASGAHAAPLCARLSAELRALEQRFQGREPIASALARLQSPVH